MGGAKKIHPECLRVADVHKTVNCSLARIMRKAVSYTHLLIAVDHKFKTGMSALFRGMRDARKIYHDKTWEPMPPLK